MVEALLRAFGYALSGTGQEQLFWYLLGIGGSGKTTLLELIAMIFGSYASSIEYEVFMRNSSEKRFGTSVMASRWMLYSSEIDEGQEWAEATLKTATGSGMMPIEEKGKPPRQVPVRWGLFFQGNHPPRFRKIDHGLMRRYVPVKFDRALPEAEQRKSIALELYKAEAPAIAARVLEARLRYKNEGMFIAPCMEKERRDYFHGQDKLGLYLEERVMFDGEAVTPTLLLYNDWLRWLDEIDGTGASRRFGGSVHKFIRDLKERHDIRHNGVRFDRKRVETEHPVSVAIGLQLAHATSRATFGSEF